MVNRLWKFALEELIALPLCPSRLTVVCPVPHLGRSRPLDSQAKMDIRSGRLGPAIWGQGMRRNVTLAISRSIREPRLARKSRSWSLIRYVIVIRLVWTTPCDSRSAKVIAVRLVWTTPCDPRSAKVIAVRLVWITPCDLRSAKVIAIGWDAIAISKSDQECNHDEDQRPSI